MDTTTTTHPRLIPLSEVKPGSDIAPAYTRGTDASAWVTTTGAPTPAPQLHPDAIAAPVVTADGATSRLVGDRHVTRVWVR